MTGTPISLEDVLDAITIEEAKPSDAALARWAKHYPQYADELARYFAIWSLQDLLEKLPDPVAVNEESLVKRGVNFAFDLVNRQGRLGPDIPVEPLGPFNQLVLTAIHLMQGDAYNVNITQKVSEMSGRTVLLGSTLASLDRLERAGLIMVRIADSRTDPELKGRRYFTASMTGERALAEAKETSRAVADFLGEFA
jgi:DNA-binding PadR family transcriptional regulator